MTDVEDEFHWSGEETRRIEVELSKVDSYKWSKKQDNEWDRLSRFIYSTKEYSALMKNIRGAQASRVFLDDDFEGYAICRWYNFWTSRVIEDHLFGEHKLVSQERNRFHKKIDFYIDGINFDLKCSAFPQGFRSNMPVSKAVDLAIRNPSELIRWLYLKQSGQGRWHASNRLFIVFADRDNPRESWRLKKQFANLKILVNIYLDNFDGNLFTLRDNELRSTPCSDILFFLKDKEGFRGIFYTWENDRLVRMDDIPL